MFKKTKSNKAQGLIQRIHQLKMSHFIVHRLYDKIMQKQTQYQHWMMLMSSHKVDSN